MHSSNSIRKRIAVNTNRHNFLRSDIRQHIVAIMNEEKPLVARNLEWLIANAQSNPYKLAEELSLNGKKGVPQPTIHRILEGQHKSPRNSTLEPIAKYFRVKLSDLLEWDFKKNGFPAANVKEDSGPYKNPDPALTAWINLWHDMKPHERDAVLEQIPITRRLANGNQQVKLRKDGGSKESHQLQK